MYRLHRGIMASGDGLYAAVRSFGPAAWYQPGVGVTTSLWPDQSGNSRDMTLYNTPTVNADGSVTFNGTNQYGKTAAFTLNQPITLYLVVKQISWTVNDSICDGNANTDMRIYQSATTPGIKLQANSAPLAENANLAVGAYGIVTGIWSGAASSLQVNATTATTGDPGSNGAGGFTLGSQGDGLGTYSNIQVKEAILFAAAHDAGQRATVRNYLAARHGIAL